MTNFRETSIQIIIIILAAAAVILAIIPLENTSWAESLRTEMAIEEGGEGLQQEGFRGESGEPQIGGPITYVGSFIKIMLFMGIPGLITIGVLRLTNRKPKPIAGGTI